MISVWAGHGISLDGSKDSGCTYTRRGKTYTEAWLVERITKSCVHYLRASGVEVLTDVPGNKINMTAQVRKSNAKKAKIHVAFHCDYSKAPSGTIPLYASDKGKRLAKLMNKYVLQYSSLKTRGLCKRTDLYELNATTMPAVIFEVGSIKSDLDTMIREFDAIGFGAARGICAFLGVKFDCKEMQFLDAMTHYEKLILKNHFSYNGKATYNTYTKAAKGKKQVNCALFISWALQRIKVLPTNRRIWLGNTVNGSGAATLKKRCHVTHPNKKPKDTNLYIGAVYGYQWGSAKKNLVHTMGLRGFVNGHPKWGTCGGSDIKARDLSRPRSYYEKKPIKTLCRFK